MQNFKKYNPLNFKLQLTLISKLNEAEQGINELENVRKKITQNGPKETK